MESQPRLLRWERLTERIRGYGLRAEVHARSILARTDARHTRTPATTTRCPARGPPRHGRAPSRLDLLWAYLW